MWGRPYSTLPYGLQMYLLWDIQQMAKVALVMLWVIALHIFPDPLFMYRVAGRDGTEVADYWCQQVIHLMGEEPNAWRPCCSPLGAWSMPPAPCIPRRMAMS